MMLLVVSMLLSLSVTHVNGRGVMPWMCLERCDNQTLSQIESNAHQMNELFIAGLISSISFERFNLGPNGTLVTNNDLTDVAKLLSPHLDHIPMISSFPYPPQFLDWMRQVFNNPEPFINQCINTLSTYNYSGFNIDWEPTAKATSRDAADYAQFLSLFQKKLNERGFSVSVTFASWNNIWNWTELADAKLSVAMMSTYTGNWTLWQKALKRALSTFSITNLIVGLQSIDPNTGGPLTQQQLTERFDSLRVHNIENIAIWRAPIPEPWLPFIQSFVEAKRAQP